MKKIALIYLKGGLGNQNFQISFANYLSNLGLNVFISLSNFKISKKIKNPGVDLRELIFPVTIFNMKTLPHFFFLIFKIVIKLTKNLLITTHTDTNFRKNKIGFVNFFDGHWQNPSILIENKDFILDSISRNRIVKNKLMSPINPGSTVLHVRRGDYLKLNEELKESFYFHAIKAGKEKIENFNYTVFTDDYDWVINSNIFTDAKKIVYSSNSIDDTLETFAEMLSYENFIVGNSTFSLVPALLSNSKNKKIFVADPWFRNTNIDIEVPDAIKIFNQ